MGGLLSASANGSLTGWLGSRFLFMLFPLAQMGILFLMRRSLCADVDALPAR